MKKTVVALPVAAFAFLALGACGTPAPTTVATTSGFQPADPPATVSAPYIPVVELPLAPAAPVTEREWALIAKNADGHVGQRVVVYGQITQWDGATGASTFRANVGAVKHGAQYGWVSEYKTNTILTGDPTVLGDAVEGDLIKVEATVNGSLSYDTAIGGSSNAPQLTVTKLIVVGHV
jgi:hypothetical protein